MTWRLSRHPKNISQNIIGLSSLDMVFSEAIRFLGHTALRYPARRAQRSLYSIWSRRIGHELNSSKPYSRQLAKIQMSTIGVENTKKSLYDVSFLSDVVVIGGGACGVAVVTQLIERVKQGRMLRSITLVEKSKKIGPGLAYSDACVGTILNMHASTMGIYADDPEHFTRWMGKHLPSLKDMSFPPRHIYGIYLSSVLDSVGKDATQLGVVFRVVDDETADLNPVDAHLDVILARGTKIQTPSVVLAFGNFLATVHQELVGSPGFFSPAWPLDRLRVIPSGASVSILGSGLTAIDVAIFLAENGHKGSITFVSRNGRLPKVQGIASPYQRRYILHSLARDVETSEGGALGKVISTIKREIEILDGNKHYKWSKIKVLQDPLEEFRADITSAENGLVSWQSIIKATAPVIERYWNCMTLMEKENFLREHMSIWLTYRHAIPLENARKILALMEKGQLRVVRSAVKTRWDGHHFSVATTGGDILSEYFIEAAGQEYNSHMIESPLVKRLLTKGIVNSHPAGGISVNFSTLLASKSIHVIGSMTRGTHFYTNAIDRNAAHASRIADSITASPPRRPLHLAFFVGSDLFSHLMVSKLVPRLVAQGHTPFIFLPEDKVKRKATSPELRELGFFERQLLQDQIIPFLRSSPSGGAACLTVDQIGAHYGLLVQRLKSVNDPSFLDTLSEHHIDAGFSLRCYQRFGKNIINHFAAPRALLNLHPGTLPSYRGVMTAVRAMINKEPTFGYSLHHISSSYDSGPVLDIRTAPIDYQKSMLHYMGDVYPIGVEMVLDAVENLARGKDMPAVEQDEARSRYYTFPTEEELEVMRQKGVRLVDAGAVEEVLVGSFAGGEGRDALRRLVRAAVRKWYDSQVTEAATQPNA
ncbi:hypothetical protein IMSHALPRED_003778 [Imshaugia aleurites]|uniref:Uncharacterized protein n=1 Tax=Imshaugia aleurites TaxID=172621 RepID=A0A8H3FBT8_9LECA|nr:hypothetical protein IMSHALPRED_003778 [Imshaugia aleurites]